MRAIKAKGKFRSVLAVSFAAEHDAHTVAICVTAETTGSSTQTDRLGARDIKNRHTVWPSNRTILPSNFGTECLFAYNSLNTTTCREQGRPISTEPK